MEELQYSEGILTLEGLEMEKNEEDALSIKTPCKYALLEDKIFINFNATMEEESFRTELVVSNEAIIIKRLGSTFSMELDLFKDGEGKGKITAKVGEMARYIDVKTTVKTFELQRDEKKADCKVTYEIVTGDAPMDINIHLSLIF